MVDISRENIAKINVKIEYWKEQLRDMGKRNALLFFKETKTSRFRIKQKGLAAGLPIILIDMLPGQEEGNVEFLTQNQAGVIAEDPAQLRHWVNLWHANDNQILNDVAAKARQLGRLAAAMTIAVDLWQVSQPPASTS